VLALIIVAMTGYLIGSFPAGYIAGRMAGIDIRKAGSGNIGATNVVRVLGKRFGYAVFVVDFIKGVGAVALSIFVGRNAGLSETRMEFCGTLSGVCCVIGHVYPVWLGFRGGKGVATSIGVLFGLVPFAALIMSAVWILTFEVTRYVSVASIAAALALPVTVGAMFWIRYLNTPVLLYFSLCLAAVVVVRHRSNISRLCNGTEPRFVRK
jgi:acyl phosphate:glycerol-3-phosphate acyltransferase